MKRTWINMRKAYGEALVELGVTHPNVVVLSADVSNSDHSFMFEEAFPDRFFNVGIAEPCLVDVAVGFASSGKIPLANTFSFLFATRALEMVRTHLCYGGANVKLMGAYSGLSDSFDGPTHHSITDIAILRSLPNMTVVVPSDPVALKKLLPQVVEWPGPVFFRLTRNEAPVLFDESYAPRIGKAVLVRPGADVTLIGMGMMLGRCLDAAEMLAREGIEARVIEMHTVKPLDAECVLNAARETGAIVTVEEHSVVGGLGAAVAEAVTDGCPVPVKRVGLADRFAETGPYDDLLDNYGMSIEDITRAARYAMAARKGHITFIRSENSMDHFATARDLLKQFKGDAYLFGNDVLKDTGSRVARAGKRAAMVYTEFPGVEDRLDAIRGSMKSAGVTLAAQIPGAGPNAPREDVFRIAAELTRANPDVLVSVGGGSTIDSVKAAEVLRTLGGDIDGYFGTGMVTRRLQEVRGKLTPHVAVQTAASSGAHLTKYSNITDVRTGQKKLIVDDAIVPTHPVFDYTVTHEAPPALTTDGAMDGLAHILEVFYGAVGKPYYDTLARIARAGISLIVEYLPKVVKNPRDTTAREALCLATDLGAYAIMLGGTNGGHLTSFSLVDILSHGRACALMNPYYTVFFAPAVEGPLRVVGSVFQNAGYIPQDLTTLRGRELGIAVANGMFAFARAVEFPTVLGDVAGFTQAHLQRALTAAKNPQLKMKLENMPIPLAAETIDDYMGPILQAAVKGDLALIRNA